MSVSSSALSLRSSSSRSRVSWLKGTCAIEWTAQEANEQMPQYSFIFIFSYTFYWTRWGGRDRLNGGAMLCQVYSDLLSCRAFPINNFNREKKASKRILESWFREKENLTNENKLGRLFSPLGGGCTIVYIKKTQATRSKKESYQN